METNHQSEELDELTPIDRAMLLALSSVRRDGTPLTLPQEALLDDWVSGRLSPADVERAAELTARNGLAAERVLERRLVEAANTGSGVPAALSVRVLEAARPAQSRSVRAGSPLARSAQFDSPQAAPSEVGLEQIAPSRPRPSEPAGFRWSIFGWSAAGLAFAATIAIAVLGVPSLREKTQSDQRIQLAMVSIDDRRPFTGGSQARSLRNNHALASSAEGFRDVDIPADLLRRAIAGADGGDRARVAAQLLAYLPPGTDKADQAQVVIDSSLAQALSREWNLRTIVPIRVYDLRQASARAIQESLTKKIGTRPQVLLTVRQ